MNFYLSWMNFNIYNSRWFHRYRTATFSFLQAAIKTRDATELMKDATFISFSAASRVHRALSSPKHRDQSANLILWMNTSQGRVIQGSKSHLSRHPTLTEYYCDVGKGYKFVLIWYSVFASVQKLLSRCSRHIEVLTWVFSFYSILYFYVTAFILLYLIQFLHI